MKVRYLKPTIEKSGEEEISRLKIVNKLIGVESLGATSTSEGIFQILQNRLRDFDDPIKSNFFGITHDFGANLAGDKDGLIGILMKEAMKSFFNLDDPCHSINLAASHSYKQLPQELRSFIEGLCSHFSWPQRKSKLMNVQKSNNLPRLLPRHYIATRWLSLGEFDEAITSMGCSCFIYE